MLFTNLKGTRVDTELGEKIGKLTGLTIDTNTWKVTEIIVSHGLEKKGDTAFPLDMVASFDEEEEEIILKPEAEDGEVKEHSVLDHFYSYDLMKKKVVDNNEEKIGTVYDLHMPEDVKMWRVLKLLIDTGMSERRLRMSPEEAVKDIKEKIILSESKEDIEKRL